MTNAVLKQTVKRFSPYTKRTALASRTPGLTFSKLSKTAGYNNHRLRSVYSLETPPRDHGHLHTPFALGYGTPPVSSWQPYSRQISRLLDGFGMTLILKTPSPLMGLVTWRSRWKVSYSTITASNAREQLNTKSCSKARNFSAPVLHAGKSAH